MKTLFLSAALLTFGSVAVAQEADNVRCDANGQNCLPLDLYMQCGGEYSEVLTQVEYGIYQGEFQVPQYMVTNQADCRIYYIYPPGAEHRQFKLSDPQYTGSNPARLPGSYQIQDAGTQGEHIFLKFNGKGDYRASINIIGPGPNTLTVEKLDVAPGDVNADGQTTIVDAMLVAQHSAGSIKLDGEALYYADMDCNYTVNIADALLIAQLSAGQRAPAVTECWGLQ